MDGNILLLRQLLQRVFVCHANGQGVVRCAGGAMPCQNHMADVDALLAQYLKGGKRKPAEAADETNLIWLR
jgi:hypothetical protein